MRVLISALIASGLLFAGCGGNMAEPTASAVREAMFAEQAKSEPPSAADSTAPASPSDQPTGPTARKIIYNADISILVKDVSTTETELTALVQAAGGYIADQNILGSPGSLRSATWRVRIPSEKFEDVIRQVVRLGELESSRRNAQDVTAEYVDQEARLKNKTAEEQQLLTILKERVGELEDVLKVEIELSRVRGEIEQIQGRLRMLQNLSSLSTITISAREHRAYEPPEAPTFAALIERTFQSSVDEVVRFGKGLVLFCVAIAPWLPILVIGLIIMRLVLVPIWRYLKRQPAPFRGRRPVQSPPSPNQS